MSENQPASIDGMTWDPDRIWCLGSQIDGCKYISWYSGDVSFADCDVLIVDVRSVSIRHILSTKRNTLDTTKLEIRERSSKKNFILICITSSMISFDTEAIIKCVEDLRKEDLEYPQPPEHGDENTPQRQDLPVLIEVYRDLNNYFWFPDTVKTRRLGPGIKLDDRWKSTGLGRFGEYLEAAEYYRVGLDMHFPTNAAVARTKGGDVVACMYHLRASGAVIVMLPRLQTLEKSVCKVLEILRTEEPVPEPEWAKSIDIPETVHIVEEIRNLKKSISTKREKICALESELEAKYRLRKLVYAGGRDLEAVVLYALEMIGLDVERGDENKEDFVLRPATNSKHSMCSIEVKSSERNINRKDLRQLRDWVEDQFDSNAVHSKGILITNTHRTSDIRESKDKRSELDQPNLEYVETHAFCIVPTHVLLDLCVKKLDGAEVDASKVERALLSKTGFVSLDDLSG